MTCTPVKIGDSIGIVCTRGRIKRCACGHAATLLCDWKLGKGKTCDVAMCEGCAREVAPEKHLCASHLVDYEKWLEKMAPRKEVKP